MDILTKQLMGMKNNIEEAKKEKSKLDGKLKQLSQSQLKTDFNCDNFDCAEEKLKILDKKIGLQKIDTQKIYLENLLRRIKMKKNKFIRVLCFIYFFRRKNELFKNN